MIPHGHASDNTLVNTTSGTPGTQYLTAAPGMPHVVSTCTPPPVPISLQIVQQMRERQRQLQALQQWQQLREVAQS